MKQFLNRRQIFMQALALVLASCKSDAWSEGKADDSAIKDSLSLRLRRRWDPSGQREFQLRFTQAVAWLKANDDKVFPAGDPRSWLSWKRLASAHAQSAPRMTWFFLPWHRLFLSYFEAACRYALQDETFALPYWDWTSDPYVFPEFSENDLLNANRDWKKADRLPDEFVGPELIKRLLSIDEFFAFHSGSPSVSSMAALLEGACHHRVRNAIGGDMLGIAAANDPLFWLHHANIDRLWALWSLQHPDSVLPPAGAEQASGYRPETWLNAELHLNYTEVLQGDGQQGSKATLMPPVPAHGSMGAFPATMRVRDLLQSETLGYSYDSVAREPAVFINLNIAPGRRRSTVFSAESRLHAKALISRVTLDPEAKSLQAVRKSQGGASLIFLNLDPRPAMQIRFFAFDGQAFRTDMIAGLTRGDAWKRPEWIGSYSSLQVRNLPKNRQEKDGLNLNIAIGGWLREKSDAKEVVFVAVASDPRDESPLDLFALSTVEVQLQLNSSDK